MDIPKTNCAFQTSPRNITAGTAAKKGANAPMADVIAGPTLVIEKAWAICADAGKNKPPKKNINAALVKIQL